VCGVKVRMNGNETSPNSRVMCRAVIDKLNDVICNVETSGDFGLWMTEQGTIHVQTPNQTQLFYNSKLNDPYPGLGLQV
jgi:hypothetical protein